MSAWNKHLSLHYCFLLTTFTLIEWHVVAFEKFHFMCLTILICFFKNLNSFFQVYNLVQHNSSIFDIFRVKNKVHFYKVLEICLLKM